MPTRCRLVVLVFSAICATAPVARAGGQAPSQPSVPQATPAQNEERSLLEYASFLREEARAHREFLESYYTIAIGGLTALIAIFGGFVAWMNWRTKADIGRQVESLFRQHAESVVQSRVKQFDEYVATTRTEVDRFTAETRAQLDARLQGINRVLLDLSAQATISPRLDATSDNARFSGRRILWVDDVPRNNEHPREILSSAGVTFDLANSTEIAIELLAKQPYDLVISDMGRGRNYTAGLDLLREMKTRGYTAPVIIYASARGVAEHGQAAKALGAIEAVHGTALLLQSVQRVLAPPANTPATS